MQQRAADLGRVLGTRRTLFTGAVYRAAISTRFPRHIGGYSRVGRPSFGRSLTSLPASRSRSGILCPRRSSCSEIVPQPLRPRLADVQLRTDGTDRGNTVGCQLIGEYLCRLFPSGSGMPAPKSLLENRPAGRGVSGSSWAERGVSLR